MSGQRASQQPSAAALWPRGVLAWLFALLACALAVVMAVVAYAMAAPVPWDGLGQVGALVLYFPLHLLGVTLVAAMLTVLAWRFSARLAVWAFGFVVVLTAISAVRATLPIWQRAQELSVPVSVSTYVSHARHMNSGKPQADRTVSYGTAKDGSRLELDVWGTGQPDTGPLRPAMVFVHGGGWVHGTRSMHPDWDRWFNALDEALTKAVVPHEIYLLPAQDHGFDMNWGGFATQIARAKINDFLRRY